MNAATQQALLGIVAGYAARVNKKKRKSVWTKPLLQRRPDLGSYMSMFKELKNETVSDFINYTRVTPEVFDFILRKIETQFLDRIH